MMKKTSALLLLLLAACTPGPAPKKELRPHPFFPITEGAHTLGRTTKDGELKCTACHALTNTNYAQFDCLGCHEHAKDTVGATHANVGGYQYASRACYACHRDGTAANAPNVQALTRDSERDVVVTSLEPTWSGPKILSVTPNPQSLPMPMRHTVAIAARPCAECHVNAEISGFYPGQLHTSLFTLDVEQPTTCAECHQTSAPTGFVGPLDSKRVPQTGAMKHDARELATGAPLVSQDCSACHVAPSKAAGATWTTRARFHGNVQPTSCLDCHANTRPGVITSGDAGLPAKVVIDHGAAIWLGDCNSCHTTGFTSWTGGRFHSSGATTPTTCLPCHAGERPTSLSELDGGFKGPPFDFGTNAQGITHGAGQDCAVCHARTQDWTGGNFMHGSNSLSARTCVACHSTQRPTTIVSGFDHSLLGTGDCLGCHQASTPLTWAGGETYPGSRLISSSDRFIRVAQRSLQRGSNMLVTGFTTSEATLSNAMLHTSAALPLDAGLAAGPSPGDTTTCWHCHTSAPGTTTVTAFPGGLFHAALTSYRSAPDAGVTSLAQPTSRCTDCHSNMRPAGIVQKTDLQPMDHDAKLAAPVDIGGVMVSRVSELDCSVCHQSPGGVWSDGTLHSKLPATAQLEDCTVCHFTLMANAALADVSKMKHRSAQVPLQKCDQCHELAITNTAGTPAATKWAPGFLHASLATQPAACIDCHAGSAPTAPTQSAFAYDTDRQWMNHTLPVVTSRDCVVCHASDAKASGAAWSPSTVFHRASLPTPTTCRGCHGATNGSPDGGTNMPALRDTTTVTSASASTGRAGQRVRISHADVNVRSRECGFCHTQVGIAPTSPIAGREWAQAKFHRNFTGAAALLINGTTGRCSNCHANLAPASSFSVDHSAFTETSATDCSACHSWPGAGTATAPTWRMSAGASTPSFLSLGGFLISQPPASNATTTQAGLNSVPHPSVGAGLTCTSCHTQASGGRQAFGYDHALAPATGCASCHEAGSNLVGSPWVLNAPGSTLVAAQCGRGGGTVFDRGGDTRPIGITALACSSNAANQMCGSQNCALNHFFPADCGECHQKPTAVPATVQVGASYVANWRFQHFFGAPAQSSTCCRCHGGTCR